MPRYIYIFFALVIEMGRKYKAAYKVRKRTVSMVKSQPKTSQSSKVTTHHACAQPFHPVHWQPLKAVSALLGLISVAFSTFSNPIMHLFYPPNLAEALFSISLGTSSSLKRNRKHRLCKICVPEDVFYGFEN